jgi:hypothetical protein
MRRPIRKPTRSLLFWRLYRKRNFKALRVPSLLAAFRSIECGERVGGVEPKRETWSERSLR